MFFTSQEKSAIITVSDMMIRADGKSEPIELLGCAAVLQNINITPEECDKAKSFSSMEALWCIYHMDNEKKRFVCEFLGYLMAVDGDINHTELALWNLVSSLCELPTMTIRDAKEEIQSLL